MKKIFHFLPLILFLACSSAMTRQEKTISINNEGIQYSIRNPKSEITCFLIHGFGDNQQSFNLLLPILDSLKVKTVIYDIPGMGKNKNNRLGMAQNLKLFSELYMREKTDRNIAIGHSMGGLFMLLSIIEENLSFNEVIAIEPSITNPDYNFFKYIQEPPLGVGMEVFINKERDDLGYNKFYNQNIKNSDISELRTLAKEVYLSFDENRNRIIESGLSFTYIYGENSSGIEYRKEMSQFSNITVKGFKNAKHWVHFDAINEFKTFLIDKIQTQKN